MSWSFVLIWPHLTTFWASQVVLGGKESARRSRRRKRRGFNPWAEKTPRRRAWQPTSICLPGESLCIEEPGGLHTVLRVTESRTRNVRCRSNGADLHHLHQEGYSCYLFGSFGVLFPLSVSAERLQGHDCGFHRHLSTSTCCTSERGLNLAQSFSWRVIGNCG